MKNNSINNYQSEFFIMKNYLRFLILLISSLLVHSCFYDGEITEFGIMFFVGLGAVFVFVIIQSFVSSKEAKEVEEKRKIAQEKARLEREAAAKALEEKKTQYKESRQALIQEWGEPDKTIVIEEYNINGEIRAYEAKRKVTIMDKTYSFSDILQCQFSDNPVVVKGRTTITSSGTTKTDNGNMFGRAVVGGLVAGSAGAVIGGTTAQKNTTTTSVVDQGRDVTKHDYTVWISVKSIANPMIQIHIGKDGTKVNEIVALMNAIIKS